MRAWESGNTNPSSQNIEKICEVLGIDPYYLITPLDLLLDTKVKMKFMDYIENNEDALDDKMFLEFYQKFIVDKGEGTKPGIKKKIIDLLP